jgi:hypothetical protein
MEGDPMARLMWIAGILLAAAGLASAVLLFASTASVLSWGFTTELAALLVVGGVLSIGLGGVIHGLERQAAPAASAREVAPGPVSEFGRRVAAAAAPAAAPEVSAPVKETIEALEEARQKIEQALEPKPSQPEPARVESGPGAAANREDVASGSEDRGDAEVEATGEGQLYVVEERFIRSRPARILSDGTVEAETDEGWMRFENMEHLDEYLDASAPAKS